MSVLSVDPGKRVGVAEWSLRGELWDKFTLSTDEFIVWLPMTGQRIRHIVYESWRLSRRMEQQQGSRMEASQVIGAIKMFTAMRTQGLGNGITLSEQEPGILQTAALHTGTKLPKGHIPDDVSAYLHGYWYFETQGILEPIPLDARL